MAKFGRQPTIRPRFQHGLPRLANGRSARYHLAKTTCERFLMTRQIKITLNSSGEGTISADDLGEFPCLGDPETLYPASVSNGGKEGEEKFPELYSNVLDANIEQAVLLGWEYGLFIHAGADNLADNGGPTGGNIQLSAENAKSLYDWIDGGIEIKISKT